MTSDTIYVVVSAERAADELKGLVDAGMISRANQLSGSLKGFYDQLSAFCVQHGGQLYQHLYERSVMNLPLSCADQLPGYLDQFEDQFGSKLAMGFGFTLSDAVQAMEASLKSGEPELFDGERQYPYFKDDAPFFSEEEHPQEDPPNQFDPENPPSPDPSDHPHPEGETDEGKVPARPSAQEAAAAQQELLAAMLPAAPPATPAPQVDPRQQAMDDIAPKEEEEKAEMQADEDHQRFIGKLADSLHQVRSHLPQIMQLADHNPKAFNQAMGVISKLVGAVKQHKVAKSVLEPYEELVKKMNERLSKSKPNFPVGTVLRGKKKVLAHGHHEWRSLRSGQAMDEQGNPVSPKQASKPTGKE